MEISLVIENIQEREEIVRDLNISVKNSSVICLKSISLWIVEYYFANQIRNKSMQTKYFLGLYDMFSIYQKIQSSSSLSEFFELCKNKLKQVKNNFILKNYKNYLRRWDFIDIIDIFHQCQFESVVNTMILSIDSIKSDSDRLFFEYLLKSASSCGIYDVKTKRITTETQENLLKLIDHENRFGEQTHCKNSIKHTFCTYLSLLLNTHNEHALLHCLITSTHIGAERETIVELQCLTKLSKDQNLSLYQILHSFLQHKELNCNLVQQDLTNHDNEFFHILNKYYINIKEFFDFIEQLQMIIKGNNSIVTFRELLQIISKQLCKNLFFNQYDSLIKEMTEEFCQDFQSIFSMINRTSPIQSTSSEVILTDRRFLQSMVYLCAKQTIDLSVIDTNYDHLLTPSSIVIDEKAVNRTIVCQSKTKEKSYDQREFHQCLDLSTIHETSFESDSILLATEINPPNNKIQCQLLLKRQPLREIDVNSFNNEEQQIDNEKNPHHQKSIGFTLISDDDKENLPIIRQKRSSVSITTEPPSKKQKKTNLKSSVIEEKN